MMKRPKHAVRLELEYIVLPFDVAGPRLRGVDGWLRTVRRLEALSASVVAEHLGVRKREVLRLEVAEKAGAITLGRLRQLAAVMGSEVVYAIVPKETTFEEIAAQEKVEAERVRSRKNFDRQIARGEDENGPSPLLLVAKAVRKQLRRLGVEVVRDEGPGARD